MGKNNISKIETLIIVKPTLKRFLGLLFGNSITIKHSVYVESNDLKVGTRLADQVDGISSLNEQIIRV